ncbi:hypothetical protein [Xylella fastidiosa]
MPTWTRFLRDRPPQQPNNPTAQQPNNLDSLSVGFNSASGAVLGHHAAS